jgi:hypothetical protein
MWHLLLEFSIVLSVVLVEAKSEKKRLASEKISYQVTASHEEL